MNIVFAFIVIVINLIAIIVFVYRRRQGKNINNLEFWFLQASFLMYVNLFAFIKSNADSLVCTYVNLGCVTAAIVIQFIFYRLYYKKRKQ